MGANCSRSGAVLGILAAIMSLLTAAASGDVGMDGPKGPVRVAISGSTTVSLSALYTYTVKLTSPLSGRAYVTFYQYDKLQRRTVRLRAHRAKVLTFSTRFRELTQYEWDYLTRNEASIGPYHFRLGVAVVMPIFGGRLSKISHEYLPLAQDVATPLPWE